MNKDIKRKLKNFTKFLKENNCYIQYFNNYDNYYDFLLLIKNRYMDLFLSPFNWSKSKEGHKFWQDLDNKWNNYISD